MSERLRQEREFLAARLARPSHEWVGISSNEMVRAAITDEEPDPFNVPYDAADMGRCDETYLRAPAHLRPRLKPILEAFRVLLAKRGQRPSSYTKEQAAEWLRDAFAEVGGR